MKRLDGKVSLIFGGASGMARATAKEFAAQGSKVVIADLSEEGAAAVVAEIQQAGGEAAFIVCNVKEEREIIAAVQFAVDTYGKLDIMLYQPGRNAVCNTLDLEAEVFQDVFQLNLLSAFLAMKYAARQMQENGGSILLTSSLNSTRPCARFAAYCSTKAGLDMLVKVASLELGPRIRVNTINPGFMNTPQIANFTNNPEIMEVVMKSQALGRIGEPEDFAKLALFLASDEASFITGSNVIMDGACGNFGYPDIIPIYMEWKKRQSTEAGQAAASR